MLHVRIRPARPAAALALAIAAIGCGSTGTAAAPAHPDPRGTESDTASDLRRARKATRIFRDVDAARAAGYAATGPCAETPSTAAWASTTPTPTGR